MLNKLFSYPQLARNTGAADDNLLHRLTINGMSKFRQSLQHDHSNDKQHT